MNSRLVEEGTTGAAGRSAVRAATAGAVLWAGALAVLTGCAGAEPTPEEQAREVAKQETFEDILNKPLAAEEYGADERCLSLRSYDHVDVLDDQHLVFRGRGEEIWVNELRQRCLGLRSDDVLEFSVRGGNRVCDLDNFQAIDPFHPAMSGPVCSLGMFMPVTPEQLEALEAAVKESRK